MTLSQTIAVAVLGSALMITLPACERQGPAQDAGERIDDTFDDAGDAVDDATDRR